jgi:hypothetical protein
MDEEIKTDVNVVSIEMAAEEINAANKIDEPQAPEPSPSNPQSDQPQKEELSTIDASLEEELKEVIIAKEKEEREYKDIALQRAISEKALESYVMENIRTIWKAIYDEEVTLCDNQHEIITATVELKNGQVIPQKSQVCDLYIECASGNKYVVELKNKQGGNRPLMDAVAQVLFYSLLDLQGKLNKEDPKMVILSTYYTPIFEQVIKKYNLPIDFILFGETGIYQIKFNE